MNCACSLDALLSLCLLLNLPVRFQLINWSWSLYDNVAVTAGTTVPCKRHLWVMQTHPPLFHTSGLFICCTLQKKMPNLTCSWANCFHYGRQGMITWKHCFGWLKTLRHFYFQSSGWSFCLSPRDGLLSYFLQSGRGYLNPRKSALVVTTTFCSGRCFWSCSIKNLSLSTLKTWGCLSSCRESAVHLQQVKSETNFGIFIPWNATQH